MLPVCAHPEAEREPGPLQHGRPPADPVRDTHGVSALRSSLSERGYQEFLATVSAGQILGGPAWDALIAFTAAEHQATLLSLDQRATATYQAVGVTVEQLVP